LILGIASGIIFDFLTAINAATACANSPANKYEDYAFDLLRDLSVSEMMAPQQSALLLV